MIGPVEPGAKAAGIHVYQVRAKTMTVEEAYRTANRALVSVVVLAGIVIVLHETFWPFGWVSPLAGEVASWTSALIVVSDERPPAAWHWEPCNVETLRGDVIGLEAYQLNQAVFAPFIKQDTVWTPAMRRALRARLAPVTARTGHLVVYRVHGTPATHGRLAVTATPLAYLTPDTLILREDLR